MKSKGGANPWEISIKMKNKQHKFGLVVKKEANEDEDCTDS